MNSDRFEEHAAHFVSRIADTIPRSLTSLVFSSPLSARSPDLNLLWHTGYRENHKARVFLGLLLSLVTGFVTGLVRLIPGFRPFGYAVYGTARDSVLVLTTFCGKENSEGVFVTPYVRSATDDCLFVFGRYATCGRNAKRYREISLCQKVSIALLLTGKGVDSFFRISGGWFERACLLVQWLEWSLSLQWVYDYALEQTLSRFVQSSGIVKIGCIHEMHFYSRIVWRVAAKNNAKGFTVQHAAITPGKRWYFTHPRERESGLALPDVMYIFNQGIEQMLKPYYPATEFRLGCSSRYDFWRDVKPAADAGSYCLFAGALAGFDNEVVLSTVRRITHGRNELPLRVRLHPHARINLLLRWWLHSAARRGAILISRDTPLEKDIACAIGVVGMSTTVLEEALLMGKPVVQLTHPQYLHYIDIAGIRGAVKKDWLLFSTADLPQGGLEVDRESMRERLGLNQQVITYQELFLDK